MAVKKNAEKATKKMRFEYGGTEYTLEFNRSSLRTLDNKYDFSINDIEKMQVSSIPDLFYCAFLMHHGSVKYATTEEIWALIPNKDEAISTLLEMYAGAINSIMDDEVPQGKAISWTTE